MKVNRTMLKNILIAIGAICLLLIAYFLFVLQDQSSNQHSNNVTKPVNKLVIDKDRQLFVIEFNEPLTSKQINKYADYGIHNITYKNSTTYYAHISKKNASNLKNIIGNKVLKVVNVSPASKIPYYIQKGKVDHWVTTKSGDYKLNIEFIKGISPQHIKEILLQHNVSITNESIIENSIVSIEINPNLIKKIASIKEIIAIDTITPPMTVNNIDAAIASNVPPLQAITLPNNDYNLFGKDIKVQVVDGGSIRDTHQEFNQNGISRVVDMTPDLVSSHATHVAGTIGASGVDEKAKGIASKIDLYGYSFLDSNWRNTLIENGFNLHGLRISNHSYGISSIYKAYLGRYLLNSKEMDDSIYKNPKLLVVKAAGNDRRRTLSSYNKKYGITKGVANSKNVLTIGAANDAANAVTKTDGMTDFSSWGPVLDGRIKPDLVANGQDVYSSDSKSDTDYVVYSGTSMAAPVASGVVALIAQEYKKITGSQNIRADTLKALLVNTATDLGNTGPDYVYGFGMINAKKAVDLVRTINSESKVFLNSISNHQNKTYRLVLAQDSEVKITLSWLDSGADVTSQDKNLVNDIDILLFSNDEYFYPYSLDKKNPSQKAKQNKSNSVDNTEQIKFNLKAGSYTFKVSGKHIVNGYQPYAIASSHNLIPNEDIAFNFNQMTLPDLIKGSGEIKIPMNFLSSDNGFAYIDAYSEDGELSINVDKSNILTIKSTIDNTNNDANITINALVGDKIFTKTLNINLLDPKLMFKSTFNLYKNTQITNTVNYKHIVTHNNKIYASDYINNTINVYNLDGVLLTTIGSQLSNPKGLAFKGDKLYVVNSNSHQIQVYNNQVLEHSFGSMGSGDYQFNTPNAIAIDNNGTIFISDNLNKRIQIFDSQYNFVKTLELKLGGRKFYDVTSLVFNSKNELFVVDRYANKVHKFDSELNHIDIFGEYGSGNGKLDLPHKIFSDVNDNLYILDKNALQIFNSSGNFMRKVDGIEVGNIASLTSTQDNIYTLNFDKKMGIFDFFSLRKKYNKNNELRLSASDFIKEELYNNAAVSKIKITDLPSHGKLYNNNIEVNSNALIPVSNINFRYVPSAASLADSFKFSAGNEKGFTHNSMRIIIEKNTAPTLSIDEQKEIVLDEGGAFEFAIIDDDNKVFNIRIVSTPAHGTIQIQGNIIKYIAEDGYSGTDTFTIEVDDGDGGVISKVINVNINEINDYPVVKNLESNAWQYLPDITMNDASASSVYFDNNDTPYNVSITNANIELHKFDSSQWNTLNFSGKVHHTDNKDIIDFNNNNVPYIVFSDANNQGKASVMKYTSANNWQYVGTSSGISAGVANYYSIQISNNNIPYVIYEDTSKLSSLTVKKFDGTNWIAVSDTGFDNSNWQEESKIDGFNKHISSKILMDNNNDIYVVFKNYENKGKVGVKKLINKNWENILFENTQDNSIVTHLDATINSDNELLISSIDSNNKLSVKKYANSRWTELGKDNVFDRDKVNLSIDVNNDSLVYISYLEDGLLKINFFNHERWQEVRSFNDVGMTSLNMKVVNNKIFINYIKNNRIRTLHYDNTIKNFVLEDERNAMQIVSVDTDDTNLKYEIVDGFDSHFFTINSVGRISFRSPPKYSEAKDFNKDNLYLLYIKVVDKEGFTLARVEIKVASKEGFEDKQGDDGTSGFASNIIRSFNISLVDEAGNESAAVTFSVIKDTQAPNKPHIDNLPYTTTNNKETVTVEGQIGTYVYLNNTNTNQIIGNNGTVNIDLDVLNNAGNSYKISLKDEANNESEALEFVIYKLTYDTSKIYVQLGRSNLVNAQVNVYEIVASGNLTLIASHITDSSGIIPNDINLINNNKFYLYEASLGNNNKGTIRAVVKGQWLRNRGAPFIVSLASEIIYDFIAADIKYNFNAQTLENKINHLSSVVVNDLNGDSVVNGKDTILYNQDIHTSGMKHHYQSIKNEITALILKNDLSYINLVFKGQTPKQYINITSDNISSALFSKDEKYAYISTDQGLRILDISNPLSVQEVAYHKEDALKNITQAYLSEDGKFYVAINPNKKKFVIADVSSFADIQLGNEVVYLSDSSNDEIINAKFIQNNSKLYLLSKKTIGYYLVNDLNNLELKIRLGNLELKIRLGNIEEYIPEFKSFAVSNAEKIYFIGQNNTKILVLDMPNLSLTGWFSIANKNTNSIHLTNNDTRLSVHDEFGIILLDIAKNNSLTLAGYKYLGEQQSKHSTISTYGDSFFISKENELLHYAINKNNLISQSYSVDSLNAEDKVSTLKGNKFYTQNTQQVKMYDYSLFLKTHYINQPILLSDFNEYTNKNAIVLKIAGNRGDSILVNGQPVAGTINSFFTKDIHHTLNANDGENEITVQFKNNTKLSDELKIHITKDTIAPEIRSFSPVDKRIISTDYIGVNLTYDDNIGIDIVNSSIYIDNQEIDNRAIRAKSFTYNLSLDDKRHKVTANIVDYAGNKTVHEYTFTIDTKIPVVTISKPGGNYSYDLHVILSSFKDNAIYYTLDGSEPNANSTLYTTPIHINATKTLKYFAKNSVNAKTSIAQTQIYNLNLSGPQVLSGYPRNGQTLGGTDEFIYKFQSLNGIGSVKIFDKFGNDLSHLLILDGNVLRLKIDKDTYKKYHLVIVIQDTHGNETRLPVEFSVDTVAPSTRVSINGGHFTQDIVIDLKSDENATIHYSIDGYPPVVGAANTISAASPIKDIDINRTTNLQFFAIDSVGNIGQTKSEVYYFNTLLAYNANLQAVYRQSTNKVSLSWAGTQNTTTSYNIYKVENVIAKSIIQKSIDLSYSTPKKYLLTTTSNTSYSDRSILNGSKYFYAISQVANGIESLTSTIVAVNINNNTSITSKQESINRATAYLNKSQNIDGTWSQGRFKNLATAQVIDALYGLNTGTYASNKALYAIKGQYANNNDFLARKITTLARHNINSDSLINKLLSQGDYVVNPEKAPTNVGWGAYKGFRYSAYETALAMQALKKRKSNQTNSWHYAFNWYSPQFLGLVSASNTKNASKWQANSFFTNDYSVYVSALSHSVHPNSDTSKWLIQQQNGSYGDGLLDTAGVLLYMDSLSSTNKTRAINYMISQQAKNGSFGDIATTAICLNALRSIQ